MEEEVNRIMLNILLAVIVVDMNIRKMKNES